LRPPTEGSRGPNRASWIRGSLWLLTGQAVSLLVGALAGLLIARWLGPARFGIFSVVIVSSGFVSIATTFRLDQHLIGVLDGTDEDRTRYGTAVRAAYVLTLPVCVVLLIAIAIGFTGEARSGALSGLATVLVAPLLLSRSVLQVQGRQRSIVAAAVVGRLFFLAGTAPVLILAPAHPVAWLIAASAGGQLIEGWLMARSAEVPFVPLQSRRGRLLSAEVAVLGFAWPLAMAGLAGTAYHRIDQLILAALRSSEEVGRYAAGVRLTELLSFVAAAVVSVTTPALVRIAREGSLSEFRRATTDMVLLIAVPAGLGVALLISAGGPLAWMLFGEGYGRLGPTISLLAVAEFPIFLGSVLTAGLLAVGARKAIAVATLIGLAVNVVANLVFIPSLGAVGAAWASLVAYSVSALVAGTAHTRIRVALLPGLGVLTAAGGAVVGASILGRVLGTGTIPSGMITAGSYVLLALVALPGPSRRLFAYLRTTLRSSEAGQI
jgi:O-antigen/teichoic acid export membrane protein